MILPRKTKIYVIIFSFSLILLWWFFGGQYLSRESSSPLINKEVTFTEDMVIVSPIPSDYIDSKIRKKYHRIIIPANSQIISIDNAEVRKNVKPFDESNQLWLSAILNHKTYGFLAKAFKYEVSYLVLRDNQNKEYILIGGRGYERFN